MSKPVSIPLSWLTWVYVLAAVGILMMQGRDGEQSKKKPLLSIATPAVQVSEASANALASAVSFELSEPLAFRLEVPLTVTDGSAKQGEHYDMRKRPQVVFEKGAIVGALSGEGGGCDVLIRDDHDLQDGAPRTFTLTLEPVEGIVDLDASRSTCRVAIDDDEKPSPGRVKIRFASGGGELREPQVAPHEVEIRADVSPAESAEMIVVIERMHGTEPTEVGRRTFVLEPGKTAQSFRISDVVPLDRLEAVGLADDAAPGPPLEFVIRLSGQHPLYAAEPRELAFRVVDDDPPAMLGMTIQDGTGRPLDRVQSDSPFWIVGELDRDIRVDTPLDIHFDHGSPIVTGTLAAGERRVRIGPLPLAAAAERFIEITMAVPAGSAAIPFVKPARLTKRLHRGPKDPGRFGIIVVNTSRLREPGNGILEAATKYMDPVRGRAFRKGVLLMGPKFIWLAPASDKEEFRPLVREDQGLSAQLQRITRVVKEMRSESEDPTIPIIIVWAERALESPTAASKLEPVDSKTLGPIVFLCPDADPDASGALRAALVGKGGGEGVSVRCPDVDELADHIGYAIDGYQAPGRTK